MLLDFYDPNLKIGKGLVAELALKKEEYQAKGYQVALRMENGQMAYILPAGYNDMLDSIWGKDRNQLSFDWGPLITIGWRIEFDYFELDGKNIVVTFYNIEPPANHPLKDELVGYLKYFRRNSQRSEQNPENPLYSPAAKVISPEGLEIAKLTPARGTIRDINFSEFSVSKKFYNVSIELEDGAIAYMLFGSDRVYMDFRWDRDLTDDTWRSNNFVGWSIEVKTVDWRGFRCVMEWKNLKPPTGVTVSDDLRRYLIKHAFEPVVMLSDSQELETERAHGEITDTNLFNLDFSGKFYNVEIELEDGNLAYILFDDELTDRMWEEYDFRGWLIDVDTIEWTEGRRVVNWGNLRPPEGLEVPENLRYYLRGHRWD